MRKWPVIGGMVAAGLVLGVGGGVASHVLHDHVQPAAGVFELPAATPSVETPAPAAPAAVAPTVAPVAAPTPEPQAVAPQAPKIATVTGPTPQAPAPAPNADPAIGTVGDDGRYTAAPVRPKAGEPPVLPDPGAAPAPPMRGEPGYVSPNAG